MFYIELSITTPLFKIESALVLIQRKKKSNIVKSKIFYTIRFCSLYMHRRKYGVVGHLTAEDRLNKNLSCAGVGEEDVVGFVDQMAVEANANTAPVMVLR